MPGRHARPREGWSICRPFLTFRRSPLQPPAPRLGLLVLFGIGLLGRRLGLRLLLGSCVGVGFLFRRCVRGRFLIGFLGRSGRFVSALVCAGGFLGCLLRSLFRRFLGSLLRGLFGGLLPARGCFSRLAFLIELDKLVVAA